MSLEYNDLYQLVPVSVVQNVACFVIYDEHPRDDNKIDITICTKQGEVREYYKNALVSSVIISFASDFRRIIIVRSSQCDLYYLVEAHDGIIILSRKDNNLCVYHRFHFVKKYELCDLEYTGEVALKIITEHTTKYYSVDDEFQNISDINLNTNSDGISAALGNKLKEAIDNLECNKKAYNQILNLRQRAAYFIQNPEDIKIERPIVKFCNKNIVILLRVRKMCNESMENVHVLIHNNSSNSTSYITKYCDIDQNTTFPGINFFKETESTDPSRAEVLIAAVVPLKEFKSSIISKIEFNLVVSYQRQGKNYLQPCENVYVSASDVMGKSFDVLRNKIDERYKLWAVLFSSKKTTLYLKQIIPSDQFTHSKCIERLKIFCDEYLRFELLDFREIKIAVHRFSPNHILHGTMIVFNDNKGVLVERDNHFELNFKIDVYARSSSQVLALIHFMYDSIPHALIVTTPNIEVTHKEFSNPTGNVI